MNKLSKQIIEGKFDTKLFTLSLIFISSILFYFARLFQYQINLDLGINMLGYLLGLTIQLFGTAYIIMIILDKMDITNKYSNLLGFVSLGFSLACTLPILAKLILPKGVIPFNVLQDSLTFVGYLFLIWVLNNKYSLGWRKSIFVTILVYIVFILLKYTWMGGIPL